ncbi:AMP-binding protein [Prochlorococcus marinus]|uniref:AMP-binding protein n=1 Tax=Prochlorococcus marinus TaxID=1219 RepID=UPI001B251467|nr:AMP-binding protein [Prochlorococcus marinus]MBO8216509.1 AMP-binding protein [Prochlorococcus marinus XMU1405]MBW3039713.1 O-succinylbenzoic acid--CoA ligase [Prochlorococcus marinus str. MU1405]MBW3047170.1 O-succinylbenzoic acid--CoA ligase [Prochlorococcus marinus str. MU1406]
MKNKIYTIEVENNEPQSVEKIIEKIRENKIIYVKSKFYEDKYVLDAITENGPAIILNSSGSSGTPRQCFHHLDNLKLSAAASGQWLIEQGFELQNCLILNTLPLNHISGLMSIFRSQTWGCDCINISPNFIKNTRKLLLFTIKSKKNKKHLITSLVPTQLQRLLAQKDGISWLKIFDLIWVGGASISDETAGQCIQEKIKLAPCYGSTETSAMVTSLKPKEFLMGFKNVGEILPDTKIRINEQGLIEIKSARIGIEIIDSSKTKNFKNKNGWWCTGDLGEINQINNSLYLNFLGRSDNAFNSGGEIVFPKVIESRLNDFIMKENIPINKFNISKVSNKLWGNKIEVIVEFRELTNNKNIEIYLNLLKKFSQSWPKHEKPEKWIVKSKNTITEKINYKFKK